MKENNRKRREAIRGKEESRREQRDEKCRTKK